MARLDALFAQQQPSEQPIAQPWLVGTPATPELAPTGQMQTGQESLTPNQYMGFDYERMNQGVEAQRQLHAEEERRRAEQRRPEWEAAGREVPWQAPTMTDAQMEALRGQASYLDQIGPITPGTPETGHAMAAGGVSGYALQADPRIAAGQERLAAQQAQGGGGYQQALAAAGVPAEQAGTAQQAAVPRNRAEMETQRNAWFAASGEDPNAQLYSPSGTPATEADYNARLRQSAGQMPKTAEDFAVLAGLPAGAQVTTPKAATTATTSGTAFLGKSVAPEASQSATSGAQGATGLAAGQSGATGLSEAFSGNPLAQQIWEELQKTTGEARTANEQRYADILAQLEGVGTQQGADIDEAAKMRQADLMQQMVSSGLAGTTVPMAGGALIERERSAEQRRLAEQVALMKTGVMERRTDAYPEISMYAQLLQNLGYAQPEGEGAAGAGTGAAGGAATDAGGLPSSNVVPGSGAVRSVMPGTLEGGGTPESYAGLTASQAGALERELADLQNQHAATIRALQGQTQGSTKSRLENQLNTLEGQINAAQGKLSAYNQGKASAASEAQAKAEWEKATGGQMPYPGQQYPLPAGVGPTSTRGGTAGTGLNLQEILNRLAAERQDLTRSPTGQASSQGSPAQAAMSEYQKLLNQIQMQQGVREQQGAQGTQGAAQLPAGETRSVFDKTTKGMVQEIWDGKKWMRVDTRTPEDIQSNIQAALQSFLR